MMALGLFGMLVVKRKIEAANGVLQQKDTSLPATLKSLEKSLDSPERESGE